MKKRIIWSFAALCLALFVAWVIWGNTALEVTQLSIEAPQLPKGFDGFRIAQVSDLHNATFGRDNADLLAALEAQKPDIIVITGDMVDARNTDVEVALHFAEKAVAIAPTYYCTGNHEQRLSDYDALSQALRLAGVTVLANEKLTLERQGDTVVLAGIDDPNFMSNELYGPAEYMTGTRLQRLELAPEEYTILLSHRPELLQVYAQYEIDLVFSGHAHGGQFRFPWGGGVFAPHQGFFPSYTEGAYYLEDTTMVVSRGLGNSLMPLRVNNRPELVVTVLRAA